MGVSANIVDGKVANNAVDTSKAISNVKDSSSLNKDDFLQLLVAEMKYQDPLEPTSNTEYIAQYAQFSQVEMMQNMQDSNNLANATQLVGKYVTMDVTSASGQTSQVSGRVEYVNSSGSDVYLFIDGVRYNYANLNTVWSDDYLDATDFADNFRNAVNQLPAADKVTLDQYDQVMALLNAYNMLSDYQKGFIDKSYTDKLTEVGNAVMELKKAADEAAKKAADEAAKKAAEDAAKTSGQTT